MIAYFNNQYLEKDKVRISPDDRGFLFSDGLYEVIRHYPGHLFRSEDHIRRLTYGAAHLQLPRKDFTDLEGIARELINQNNLAAEHALVYIQVTRGAAPRTHCFPEPETELTVYATATPFDPAGRRRSMEQGIHAVTVPDTRWARCDMKTTGLTANVLANQRAKELKAEEALFIRDGVLMEGTHSNVMAVIDKTVVTAPLSNYILGGVTRKFVLLLCRKLNIKFAEWPIYEKDLGMASEFFITGTTTEVTPVVRLNGRQVRDGAPGPVTRKLQQAFDREIRALTTG